jgi:hypothetical protein
MLDLPDPSSVAQIYVRAARAKNFPACCWDQHIRWPELTGQAAARDYLSKPESKEASNFPKLLSTVKTVLLLFPEQPPFVTMLNYESALFGLVYVPRHIAASHKKINGP